MKAIVHSRYGPPDVLTLEEVERPVVKDDEVLIRVRAASVNPYDWHLLRGTPYIARLAMGLRKPQTTQMGVDVAGEVEAIGRNITQFKPGDEVFGSAPGAFAEYACTFERALEIQPKNTTVEQAACVRLAGLTALQGLRDHGKLQSGHSVLINGAAGGVGTFAVQIAKSMGAEVTAVCSTRNEDMVRSIGADRIIDYTQEDFTTIGGGYDLILDNIGNHSLFEYKRILNSKGKYVLAGGGGPNEQGWIGPGLSRAVTAPVFSWFASQKMGFFVAKPDKQDLTILRDLVGSGKITPVIDRRYSLREVPEALRYLEAGHARGKVVINVETT